MELLSSPCVMVRSLSAVDSNSEQSTDYRGKICFLFLHNVYLKLKILHEKHLIKVQNISIEAVPLSGPFHLTMSS